MDIPVLESSYKLIIDEGMGYKIHPIGIDIEPEISHKDGKSIYTWQLNLVEPRTKEDFMPPENRIQKALFFAPVRFKLGDYWGSCKTWDEFSKWYLQISEGKYMLPAEGKKKISQLINHDDSDVEKIKKIYSFLQDYTRYVALYLDIGGWQPHSVESIYANKYGDCKDLSTFMISMLDEAGIESYPALVLTRDKGMVIKEFSSNQFNHMITFIPLKNDTMWLECTADYFEE